MNIKKVCVIGGGLMGRQIALNTAIYPYEVTIFDANPAVLEDVAKWEDSYLAGRIAKGRMTEEQVAGIRSRFTICSTLEEACHADVLLVLTDASDPNFQDQLRVSEELLCDLGAGGKPTLYVFNKCDLGMAQTPRIGRAADENVVFISARTGQGVDLMIEKLTALGAKIRRVEEY